MLTSEFDQENVIPVKEANLKDEQKQAIAKAMEDYKQQCLRSFSMNRSGEVIQKDALPAPRQDTFEANPGKLQEMVDSAINRALINQAGVLSNTVFNVCGPLSSSARITSGHNPIGCCSRCGCIDYRSSKYVGSH